MFVCLCYHLLLNGNLNENRTLSHFLLNPLSLAQWLAHSRYSIKMCGINEHVCILSKVMVTGWLAQKNGNVCLSS